MKLLRWNYPLYRYCSRYNDIEQIALFQLYSGIYHYPQKLPIVRGYSTPYVFLTLTGRRDRTTEVPSKSR
jgi:hypothetical protein